MASHPLPALAAPTPLPAAADDAGHAARWGWIAAIAFFGLFLGWAAVVRLDAAAHATGVVAVAGNRQSVQHREGGTVSAIHVREGQKVRTGDVLIELAAGEVLANERALTAQVLRLEAERARLIAEQTGAPIAVPAAFATLSNADRAEADRAMALQRAAMAARRAAIGDQKRVLDRQAAELARQVEGTAGRARFSGDQDRLYGEELTGLKALADQGYVSRNRVRELERRRADTGGQMAGLAASAAAAREEIGEKRMAALTLDSQHAEKVGAELRETEAALGDAIPKWHAARQQLEATRIRATASGQVVGLQVFTVGGVIAPGQRVLEIVPDRAALVVEAQLSPDDADDVHVGQAAEVRVTAIHDRSVPPLAGTISRVSADAFHDDRTGQSYYTVTVTVPPAAMAALRRRPGGAAAVKPGLPAEILVTLRERTMLQYLLEPIDQAAWRGLHEH